jgi:hypothetical protein
MHLMMMMPAHYGRFARCCAECLGSSSDCLLKHLFVEVLDAL